LLETLEVVEKLVPREINIESIAYDLMDQIMGAKMKGTNQQKIQLYRVVKA
jgi:hypothetical protein